MVENLMRDDENLRSNFETFKDETLRRQIETFFEVATKSEESQ
jgi:hypothetical protein